jgi:hypothetical protein
MAPDGLMLQITKIDAAHRQLRTAVKMWFNDDDPVSAHTLAFAAYEVAHFVSKARNPNRRDLLFDSDHIKPDKRKEFNQAFREAANFFKHADRDPEGTIEFSPGLTELFIYFAIAGLELSDIRMAKELRAFIYYMQIRTPELMSENARKVLTEGSLIENLKHTQGLPKREFFETCMYGLKD